MLDTVMGLILLAIMFKLFITIFVKYPLELMVALEYGILANKNGEDGEEEKLKIKKLSWKLMISSILYTLFMLVIFLI